MLYLSNLLNKPLFLGKLQFAKVIDFGVPEKLQTSSIATMLIKKDGKKYTLPLKHVRVQGNQFELTAEDVSLLPYDEKDFYLAEDLLDKQVIDVTGRRLVRVNDVILRENDGLKVTGIDIGFSGVLRRLGLNKGNMMKTITIPWSQIEAFDYQTGDIKIKLSQSNLNTFHPAEIADILEDAGTKERMGVVEALDAGKAAAAIEEANAETQESILDELPQKQLENIVQKMPISEIADILHRLSGETVRNIFRLLGQEKSQKVKKLLIYPEDVAGGLMTVKVFKETADKTVAEILEKLSQKKQKPEGIIIVDTNDQVKGIVNAKNFLNASSDSPLKNIMKPAHVVHEDASFSEILKIFAEYNLRILPVVDEHEKLSGVIAIDEVLARIQQEEEKDDTL